MGCSRGLCTADKIFIFINIAFAMYSGALLSTAARLAWDPSTYTWLRFLCAAQYRVSAGYVLGAGLWLALLVYLAAARACLNLYAAGVVFLAASEICYGAWMVTSLVQWWRTSPQAALARHGMDAVHDLKPALLAVERYRDVVRPVYEMIEEVEREAPNNVFVIIIFGAVGIILQIAAFIMARRLSRRSRGASETESGDADECKKVRECEQDGDSVDSCRPPGWRKRANVNMYAILDKIF